MKKNIKIWLLIALLIALDLLSKRAFYDLKIGQALPFLQPAFNTGISRGVSAYLPFVILVSFLGLGVFFRLWKKKMLTNLIFVLFVAGTIGNLWDRIFLNGVRDFIRVGTFPIFNLADCFLTIAVVLLIRNEIFPLQLQKKTVD